MDFTRSSRAVGCVRPDNDSEMDNKIECFVVVKKDTTYQKKWPVVTSDLFRVSISSFCFYCCEFVIKICF